jgi:hypothetical protein
MINVLVQFLVPVVNVHFFENHGILREKFDQPHTKNVGLLPPKPQAHGSQATLEAGDGFPTQTVDMITYLIGDHRVLSSVPREELVD